MEVEAFLADSVVSAEGKLYAQGGGWNLIKAAQFPFRLARCGVALVFRIPYTETNKPHKCELFLAGPDGEELPLGDAPPGVETSDGKVRRLGREIHVGRPPAVQPGDEQLVVWAINLDGLVFERADRYEFVVEIDGSPVKHLGFRTLQIPQAVPIAR